MKQIVKPRDLDGDQIEAWQEKQIELAAQRWIADGDAPLPREFKKMADLTDFLASVRLREVFKSERKRVDKQRRVDAVIAAIVSERRRVSLAGPTAFLFRNCRLELPQPVGLQFLTVRELLQFRAVDRSARRAGEQDHHWIPRLRAAGVTADAPGAAPVETDWDWRDLYRSLDEVRGIKNVERDRADAEAKAMAQNDPAVLAWLRAEVEKVVRPPRPGMPPDRIDHITQSITQALLDATSAESVKRRAAKDLGPSFASATLARDLCVKRGLESAWRPVTRGGMRWPRTRAMDRFLEAVLYRWSHAKSGEKVALTHGLAINPVVDAVRGRAPRELPRPALPRSQTGPRRIRRKDLPCIVLGEKWVPVRVGELRAASYRLPRQLGPFCRAPRVVDPLFHKESL